MNILEILVQLRDDLKTWVTANINALNDKIDAKTIPIDGELSSTSTNPIQNKVVSQAINAMNTKIDEKTFPIDGELSFTSENPVQNKVISNEINSLHTLIGDEPVSDQISTAIANQDLFSGDYNDLTNAPNISEDNSNNVVIADNDGNIIFKVDADGAHTTDVEINGTSIGAKIPVWDNKSDFSGDYNDLENAPNIEENGAGDLAIVDNDGNIIFQVDAEGIHTTALDAKNITIENSDIVDVIDGKIAALVNSAPETLDTLGELADAMEEHHDAIEALEVIATSKAAQSDLDDTNANVTELQGLVGDTSVATQIAHAIEGFESFSGDYNDLTNAPNISEDGSGNMVIADEQGNVVFKVDENGAHSTALTIGGEDVASLLGQKVNKVNGKGLSSNDFTDEDKAKLDALDPNATVVIVDEVLSATSTNPIQNKAVTEAIDSLSTLIGDEPVADQIADAIEGFESFSGDYNELTNAPNINNNEDKELFIADNAGNVILRINENGINSVGMSINGVDIFGVIAAEVDAAIGAAIAAEY